LPSGFKFLGVFRRIVRVGIESIIKGDDSDTSCSKSFAHLPQASEILVGPIRQHQENSIGPPSQSVLIEILEGP
jgi:hypothetical protein